ncbi:hypothetical protein GCM10023321_85530 [Pseudonocardia eucalypti]|uniref:Transcriptional regulator n=1 Tax=Pseudonocardia eucalypti TaxID=648755 RepID=A0ABP9RF82_9PSEU|nr:hypothetical protein [Pseudonocardia eucalypti]MBB6380759.1 hypothetical protein [Pseudonocardia eucalypti]
MATRLPNTALADALASIGWSPTDLARAINKALPANRCIHPTTPFTWRDKGVVPTGSLPSLVAGVLTEALGQVVTEEDLWPNRRGRKQVHRPSVDGLEIPWSSRETLALLEKFPAHGPGTVRRFFALSGPDLVNAAARYTNQLPELLPSRDGDAGTVTTELVDYLARDAGSLRRLDDGHGGALVQRAASHQLSLTLDLLATSSYSARDGRALATVVAQLAQLAGWLHFDLDDHGQAQRCYLIALRAAGLAGDHTLAAMILSCLAAQQSWRNRPRDAVKLLGIAATALPAGASPRVKAILAMREARAHAMTGDQSAATRAIGQAERELGRANGSEPTPVWAYWLNPAVLAGETGRTLVELGQLPQAVDQLDCGIGMLECGASRDRVLYGLSLAKAHATGTASTPGDLERACYAAVTVLPQLKSVSSARCRNLLTDLVNELPEPRNRAVRDLREQAEGVLAGKV